MNFNCGLVIFFLFIANIYCSNICRTLFRTCLSSERLRLTCVPSWCNRVQRRNVITGEECPICLEEGLNFETRCQHKFHVDCLANWCKRAATCPYCRTEISTNQKLEHFLKLRPNFGYSKDELQELSQEELITLLDHLISRSDQRFNAVLQILLLMGGDINYMFDDGSSALIKSILFGSIEIVHTILAYGANVNRLDQNGSSPLHFAVKRGNKDIIRMLVKAGADLRVKDENFKTPLEIALELNLAEIIYILSG